MIEKNRMYELKLTIRPKSANDKISFYAFEHVLESQTLHGIDLYVMPQNNNINSIAGLGFEKLE